MPEAYILFEVAATTYAVPSAQVLQIEMIEAITPVPNTTEFVEGIVYLRGQVVAVVNLRSRFGLPKIPYDLRARLVVIQVAGRQVGLAVDTAREFLLLDDQQITTPPETLAGVQVEYLRGVVSLSNRLILVIDLPLLLAALDRGVLVNTLNDLPLSDLSKE